jgi:hypothetical protein
MRPVRIHIHQQPTRRTPLRRALVDNRKRLRTRIVGGVALDGGDGSQNRALVRRVEDFFGEDVICGLDILSLNGSRRREGRKRETTYQIDPNRITFRIAHRIEITRGYRARVQPVRVGCDFSGGVCGPHVDDGWVVAHGSPFGFDDALEVFGVPGEHVDVDLEGDGGGRATSG